MEYFQERIAFHTKKENFQPKFIRACNIKHTQLYHDLLSAVYVEQAKQNGRQYTNDHYTDDSVDGGGHGSVDDGVAMMVHHRLDRRNIRHDC